MDARADFVAATVDASVVWEPDVGEALQKAHILTTQASCTSRRMPLVFLGGTERIP